MDSEQKRQLWRREVRNGSPAMFTGGGEDMNPKEGRWRPSLCGCRGKRRRDFEIFDRKSSTEFETHLHDHKMIPMLCLPRRRRIVGWKESALLGFRLGRQGRPRWRGRGDLGPRAQPLLPRVLSPGRQLSAAEDVSPGAA